MHPVSKDSEIEATAPAIGGAAPQVSLHFCRDTDSTKGSRTSKGKELQPKDFYKPQFSPVKPGAPGGSGDPDSDFHLSQQQKEFIDSLKSVVLKVSCFRNCCCSASISTRTCV